MVYVSFYLSEISEEIASEAENCRFDIPTLIWRSPHKYSHKHYILRRKLESFAYIFAGDCMRLSLFFLWQAPKTHAFWNKVRSRSSKGRWFWYESKEHM